MFQGNIGHVENSLVEEEVHQEHEQIVILFWGEALIHGLYWGPLYYFDFEFKRLSPEILRQVILGR